MYKDRRSSTRFSLYIFTFQEVRICHTFTSADEKEASEAQVSQEHIHQGHRPANPPTSTCLLATIDSTVLWRVRHRRIISENCWRTHSDRFERIQQVNFVELIEIVFSPFLSTVLYCTRPYLVGSGTGGNSLHPQDNLRKKARRKQTNSNGGRIPRQRTLCQNGKHETTGSTSSKRTMKELWSQRRGKMTPAVRFKLADLVWNKEYFWSYYGTLVRREMYSTKVMRCCSRKR